MKILLICEKGITKKYENWVIDTIQQYLEKDFVKAKFIDKAIKTKWTIEKRGFSFNYFYRGKQSQGYNYWTTDVYERKLIQDTGYDVIFFLYKNTLVLSGNDYVAPVAFTTPLPSGAFYSEIPSDMYNRARTTPIHEMLHIIVNILAQKGFVSKTSADHMDTTVVNGVLMSYYKNSTPLAIDGNFHRTLTAIRPYTQYLNTDETREGLINQLKLVLADLQRMLAEKLAQAENVEPYKHFKLAEKTGSFGTVAQLDRDFMHRIDEARELAGIPFVITSGFRDEAHNKKVGGVADSAHLHRIAVDIRATTGLDKLKIVKALLDVGFTRIGISWKNNFIHVDADDSKPDTLYTY